MSTDQAVSQGTRLRALMDDHCVALPGAFNGLVAHAVRDAGFEGAYVSGGALSASSGVPDIGILTLDRFSQAVREVCDAGGLPVIADADTGFGEGEMVRRTVIEYARAGAAGLHMEDQTFPKRCGHLDGKSLIPVDHACEKVAMAAQAASEIGDGGFIVCARTDAAGVEGFDAAVERAQAYADAGASMIFPEGLSSEEDFGRFAERVRQGGREKLYLLANMTEFGKTPMLPLDRFAELGYSCVIFPVTTLRLAMGAVVSGLAELKRAGAAEGLLDSMQSRKDLYASLGYTPGQVWSFPAPRYTER